MFGKGENIKANKEIKSAQLELLLSGKTFTDENFPVSSFIVDNKLKEVIRIFYFFARTADDIADHSEISSSKKTSILLFLDKTLKLEKKTDIKKLNNLIKLFPKLKSAKKYSRQILKAFVMDAEKKKYKNWEDLIYYCKYSANPVGRFVIDAFYYYKRKPNINLKKIYKASDELCSALQIINHIQDFKEDYKNLRRIYIPDSFFRKFSLKKDSLSDERSSYNFNKLKLEMIDKVLKSLENTKKGLMHIDIWSLRKETLIILNIAKRLCNLLKKSDPLEKKIKLSRIDLIFCFIKGIILD